MPARFFTEWFFSIIIILFMLMSLMVLIENADFDDTDNPETETKSGLTLFIDYGTGCHYLSVPGLLGLSGLTNSTLIPRMDENGEQVCREDDKRGEVEK